MNNNFSFNYNKDLGEKKVYTEQVEETPINYDYNNYNKNNKQTNKYKIIGILLGGFLVILVLFIILGLSIRNNIDKIDFDNNNINKDNTNKDNTNKDNNYSEYTYDISYKIEDKTNLCEYKITTKDKYIYIVKTINDVISNYVSYNGYYYLIEENDYRLAYEKEVFDIIPYQFLDINNINNYIKLGTEKNDNIVKRYNIKIKDITLLDNTDDITINLIGNDYEIDYTNLLKLYDKYDYIKVTVNMK